MGDETPTRPHRTSSGARSVVEYRLDDLDHKFDRLLSNQEKFQGEVRAYMRRQQEQESDHKVAIERCSTHGEDIKAIKDEMIPAIHKRIDRLHQGGGKFRVPAAFWTAVIAALGSLSAWLYVASGHAPKPAPAAQESGK